MPTEAFNPRRELTSSTLQALISNGMEEDRAIIQIAQAIRDGRLPVHFVGRTTMLRSEIQSIDWGTIDVRNSTIRYKSADVLSWQNLKGGKGVPAQIEVDVSIREQLWPRDQVKHKRFTDDDTLVKEGVQGIASGRWANVYQAALELALSAQGNATQKSKVDRLRRKIGRAVPD